MSHELRKPINGVIGMTELALGSDPNSEQRENLELINASADSPLSVIDDIPLFSKIGAGKLDLESVAFGLRGLIAGTLKPLDLRVGYNGLELACRVDPSVPDQIVPGDLEAVLQAAVLPSATAQAVKPSPTRANLAPARTLSILLAEDNVINQRVAVELLLRMGHTTRVAANGQEALDAYAAGCFDLIIMDVQMPELDGFEAVAAIRTGELHSGAHIPIIALTAHAMKGDRVRCLESGFDVYLTKPIRPQELFEAIEHVAPASTGKSPARDDKPDGPAYDVRAALRATGGDPGLLDEIVRLFLDDAPRLRDQIREAIHRRDAKALRRAAHSLRGASSHFAAPSITEATKRLELSAQSEDFADADAARAALEPALDRVLVAFSESLAQPRGI